MVINTESDMDQSAPVGPYTSPSSNPTPPPSTGAGLNGPAIRRACDQCRMRKVRCDKESPCSNCRTSNRACSTSASQKPKEPRQRVLISSQYERKIDQIEERLGGIEALLRRMSTTPGAAFSVTGDSVVPGPVPSISAGLTPSADCDSLSTIVDAAEDDDDAASAFEGNSSMGAHTVFASEFLESAVQRTSLRDTSPKMEAALSSLRQIVNMQNQFSTTTREIRFPYRKQLPQNGLKGLSMPPANVVVSTLRTMKESFQFVFLLITCFISIDEFANMCQKVYFAMEDYSESTFIVVNAGLYYVFCELSHGDEAEETRAEYSRYSKLCQSNLETSLAYLNLFQPANIHNIEALLLGATYSIEAYRPSVAWILVFQAAQLCQTLGLHRYAHAQDEEKLRHRKSRLFWYTYMLDKGLALRLGRQPVLQQSDVTTPMSEFQIPGSLPSPWTDILHTWLRHSVLQGKMYEQLYSPAALSKPAEERVACARALAEEMSFIYSEAVRLTICNDTNLPPTHEWLLKSDEVSYLSTQTLIHRAIPPEPGKSGTFSTECIQLARRAMEIHERCMSMVGSQEHLKAMYIHWTILYVPFVPFIVMFCHTIETSDREALACMGSFVVSLESTLAHSEGVQKLHRLVNVLYNVADTYIEAKDKANRDQNLSPIGNEFDMYLGQLGFAPVDETMANTGAVGADGEVMPNLATMAASQNPGPGGSLGGWFSGNKYMMELLEEDGLNQFNPTPWVQNM